MAHAAMLFLGQVGLSHPRLRLALPKHCVLCHAKISDDKLFFGSRHRRILPPTPDRPIRLFKLEYVIRFENVILP